MYCMVAHDDEHDDDADVDDDLTMSMAMGMATAMCMDMDVMMMVIAKLMRTLPRYAGAGFRVTQVLLTCMLQGA